MKPELLLAHLRALLERMPDFDDLDLNTREHRGLISQAKALVLRWDRYQVHFIAACNNLQSVIGKVNYLTALSTVQDAIADLEFEVPDSGKVAFASGQVYDFFRELNQIIETAEKSVFIIDPYLDHTVFDHYLTSRKTDVRVRLLFSNNTPEILPAVQKYNQQHDDVVELRKASKKVLHDRVIFLDEFVCFAIGGSLKDAAKSKPTYLVQVPPDVVTQKLQIYNEIWSNAAPL